MEELGQSIQQFDAATMTSLARQASGRENLRLEGWQVQTVLGGGEQSSTIQRISGVGVADGQSIPWSLILKTVTSGPKNSSNPQAYQYWKREPNFYQSGLLGDLPAGLRAPTCYACLERPGNYQLFLEDLQVANPGQGWQFETYRSVGRCLGQFNGAYLDGKPIPKEEWIPRQWLRMYLEEATPNIDLFFRSLDHPIIKKVFRPIPSETLHNAWNRRHEIMDALDQLPQTFCHQDAFSGNLFSKHTPSGDKLVAIDWSFAGPAPLGAELVPLVFVEMYLGTIPFAEGDRLAQLALEGYLEGLADAGWRGNPDLVRFGFNACCFYRYPIGGLIG